MNLSRWLFRLLLGRRLPRIDGALVVPGLAAEVRIDRDAWGIPHITPPTISTPSSPLASVTDRIARFNSNCCCASAAARLSEMVGAVALPIDRLSRRIGFHRSAQQQWPVLDADIRDMLEAYARGVNAGRVSRSATPRRTSSRSCAAEPSPWTALDSLGALKLISFTLPTNWDVELARLRILTDDGPEALAALDPAYPDWLPATSPPLHAAGPMLDRLAEDVAAFTALVKTGGGSNNWTVAASRTATGRPLVANDPHLDPRLPSHWYLAHVRTPEWQTAGATFLGGPNVLCGHNGFGAWGLTAGLVDNTDLFLEQIGPDGRSVRQGDDYVPCEVRDEVIHVKNGASVTERVLLTPRGPIISPAFDGIARGAVAAGGVARSAADARPARFASGTRFRRGARGAVDLAGYLAEPRLRRRDRADRLAAVRRSAAAAHTVGERCRCRAGPTAPAGRRSACRSSRCRTASIRRRASSPPRTISRSPATKGRFWRSTGSTVIARRRSAERWPSGAIGTWRRRWRLQMDQRSLPWEEMRDIVLSLQDRRRGGDARPGVAARLGRTLDGRFAGRDGV